MPSKKKKYNARFPAGRIKKIMQTDEDVGKVAQAVPVIISRTLELFVESLLVKACQVTTSRNAKTLSPSHLKLCILKEKRFDFLTELVKNIPDVSAAEEKEMLSAESSPNATRFAELPATRCPPREDSNSSSSSDARHQHTMHERHKRGRPPSDQHGPSKMLRTETVTSPVVSTAVAIDLSKKPEDASRTPNFYQETLQDVDLQPSVIRANPIYGNPQPSTSQYVTLTPVPLTKTEKPKIDPVFNLDLTKNTSTPIINIDFTKNLMSPEFKVVDHLPILKNHVPVNNKNSVPQNFTVTTLNRSTSQDLGRSTIKNFVRSTSQDLGKPTSEYLGRSTTKDLGRSTSQEHRRVKESKPPFLIPHPVDIDKFNLGDLEIDEDYDT